MKLNDCIHTNNMCIASLSAAQSGYCDGTVTAKQYDTALNEALVSVRITAKYGSNKNARRIEKQAH